MKPGQRISELFQNGRPVFSVEFFPPKNEAGARQILRTANALRRYQPDFVSITYGAGGSTRERTLEYGSLLQEIFEFEVMPHLTCVGHSKDDLREILKGFHDQGFRNIMALRGDPPKGQTEFEPHPDGLRYASELVAFIKREFPDFCLGVGGYPEKHPEAASAEADIQHLKQKVAAGSDFITTQLFFDNRDFFKFVDNCRRAGIETPILPGILPALSYDQVTKFCAFCQATVPSELTDALAAAESDEAAASVGVDWAYRQICELLDAGAPGVHLYILNRSQATIELFHKLHAAGRFAHVALDVAL